MGEAIVITGKGGSGKTTVCALLGAALTLKGKRVLLVDASLGLRGLDLPLGLENDVLDTLTDLLRERCTLQDALLKVPGFENLDLLPASQSKRPSDAGLVEMKILVRKLKQEYDFILIDAPAGIERGFLLAAAGADKALVVLQSDQPGIRAAGRYLELLREEGIDRQLLFFNRLLPCGEKDPVEPSEAENLLGREVLGAAPECREAAFVSENGISFLKEPCAAAAYFLDAADRLLGKEIPLHYPEPVPAAEKKSLLARFLGA